MIDALLQEKSPLTDRCAPTIPVGVSNRHNASVAGRMLKHLLGVGYNLRPLSRCAKPGNSPLKSV